MDIKLASNTGEPYSVTAARFLLWPLQSVRKVRATMRRSARNLRARSSVALAPTPGLSQTITAADGRVRVSGSRVDDLGELKKICNVRCPQTQICLGFSDRAFPSCHQPRDEPPRN